MMRDDMKVAIIASVMVVFSVAMLALSVAGFI